MPLPMENEARTAFINLAWNSGWNTPELAHKLRGARIAYTPEEWISISYFFATLITLAYIPGALVIAIIGGTIVYYIPLILIPLVFYITLLFFIATPSLKARARGKRIDKKLFYSINYMASMAASGFAPLEVFRRLAANKVYGEVADEIATVVRNADMLGMDIIDAMRDLAEVTPSGRMREFLHGFISTVNSGGDIKEYLFRRLNQYSEEHRIILNEAINSQEMLSEIFVVTAVTFPLFLAIMLTILGISTGGKKGDALITEIFLLALLLQPVIFAMFIWLISVNRRDME